MPMPKALLAEDEMLVREVVREDLLDAGFEVTAVGNAHEALAAITEDAGFDLLFTDIRMPGDIDGWELGRRARELIPGLRIIYATGYSETINPLQAHERMVQKPYGFRDMLSRLQSLGLA
jgi:CheY-like chemotaxis protein